MNCKNKDNQIKAVLREDIKIEINRIDNNRNDNIRIENRLSENETKQAYSGGNDIPIKNIRVKHTVKDSVFRDLFSIPEYLYMLYRALHPEDEESTVADISDVTIHNVLSDAMYNDLGFRVGKRIIVLCEAQSTWSMNIIVRLLLYLSQTIHDYIIENDLDQYSSVKMKLPKPELYMIFTGERICRPNVITLKNDFFDDSEELCLDVKVKVLYGDGSDIISQYVSFCKIYTEQKKLFSDAWNAIENTINICKDKDILREYLENRKKEVMDIMMLLFDDEFIGRTHDNTVREEGRKEGRKDGIKEVITDMLRNGVSVDVVAKYTGIDAAYIKEIEAELMASV